MNTDVMEEDLLMRRMKVEIVKKSVMLLILFITAFISYVDRHAKGMVYNTYTQDYSLFLFLVLSSPSLKHTELQL